MCATVPCLFGSGEWGEQLNTGIGKVVFDAPAPTTKDGDINQVPHFLWATVVGGVVAVGGVEAVSGVAVVSGVGVVRD